MTRPGRATTTTYIGVIADLTEYCAARGLDILQPLQAGWYNECVSEKHRVADFGHSESLVVLIGNTYRLWSSFIEALRQNSELMKNSNPLDAYVEDTIKTAIGTLGLESVVRWAHRPQPHHIAIQQMATVAGLAWRSPTNLSIHPVYGPWIGLRAAAVFPIPGPPLRPVPAPVCESCPSACLKVLHKSGAAGNWQHQLAIRDSCPTGKQYRYSDQQIAYHYTKSRATLESEVCRT